MSDSQRFSRFKFEKSVNSDYDAGTWWKRVLKHNLFQLAMGIAAGAVSGLLYWKFVGCHSGSCPLTSSPAKTMILFSLMGGLFAYKKPAKRDEAR